MSQISFGTITIVDTTDIQRFYVEYAKSNSSAAAPTTGWSQNRPTWQNGTYVWQRTVIKKQDVVQLEYGNPVCITGEKGQTGQQGIQGNTGNGISSIVTAYCNYGTGTPTASYSGWSSNVPEYDSTKPNYWVKTTVNYTSGNPNVTIYKDSGITEAAEKANLAVTTAQTANTNSIEAISIAGSKNKIYYSDGFPTGGTYINGDTLFKQSNAGTVMYVYDDTYTDTTSGHWKQQQFEENAISDLAITNAKIANLNGDKITANTIAGNKIVAHDITALQLATDAIKSSNYVAGTTPFSNRGTFLDLSNGNMYSPVFGVNATENNQGAFIKGSVQAYDGKIGQNQLNYWYIGNYYDYNQLKSAYIKGNGTATIQLGDTSTWRLNTNRIHTAWNENKQGGDDYKLHYPVYNSKYWDMGLHVPTSKTDKFIYVRNSSSSTALSNLQNNINDQTNGTNNYWNYQFYVTSEGNLYAKNIYVLDQYGNPIQIGGSSGIAGVLPIYSGGTGSTSFTSKGIIYASDTDPQTLLSTAAGTPGQLLSSEGSNNAPSWVDASRLSVSHAVTADKATKDGNDKIIASTYMPFNGGTFTGQVTVEDSLTVQNGIIGDLTGKVNGFTLGMNVPSGSKLTDTVTTVTTSGNGNAITTISATNGKITATKESTFLTSYTQTDPLFSASAAAGIQQSDIDNWNSKTNNLGTVTSVRVQASTPLQSSVNTTQSGSLDTTISFINQSVNTVLAGPSSGTAAAAPTFRKLVAADIPSLAWSKITSGNDDLKAIEALTGTTGLLKKTAANKWTLDTTIYVPNTRTVNGHALSDNISVTKSDIGLSNVENALQIIDIGSNDSGQLVLTFGDNTTETRTVSITATTSSSVAKAEALNTNGSSIGDSKTPVYFNSDGKPVAIGYTIEKSVPANAIFSYTFDGTYNASTNKAATVSTVTNAINALDGGTIGTGGTGKTITSLSQANGQVSAIFSNISITKSQVSDFSHSHGNILNGGTITSTAVAMGNGDSLLFSDSSNSGKIEKSSITIGTGTTKYLRQDGTWGTPGGTYSLPVASSTTRGGVKIGYTTSAPDRNYAVQLSSEKMFVNVPWIEYEAASTNPLMDGTAAVGTSEKYARQDHKHPSDTSRVPTTRTINGHALSANVTITKSDIGLGNVENTALSTVLQDYVTLATEQTISGRKIFNDLASTVFKGSSGNEYCNINYDQTLSALVFSFG